MGNIKDINNGKNGNGQSQQPKRETVTIDETTPVTCECGSELFQPAYKQRKLSAAHPKNHNNEAVLIPFQTMVCTESRHSAMLIFCGEKANSRRNVNDNFNWGRDICPSPKQLQL